MVQADCCERRLEANTLSQKDMWSNVRPVVLANTIVLC